jgi:hypothetical protein
MVEKAEFCMIESVGGVDKNASTPHIQTPLLTSSFSEVESIVHFQVGSNVPNSNVQQLETIKTQAIVGGLMVGFLYARAFLLSIIITLWIWGTHKCCNASFANLSKHLKLI